MFDLDALQAAAEAATPGPWTADCCSAANMVYGQSDSIGVDAVRADAEFIAAANPAVVLELVAAHRAALARIARVEALHEPVNIEPSETICGHCSYRLPNGRYFGKVIEWPCPTVRALTEGEPGE